MNTFIQLFHEPSLEQFGWVLIHFLWQGTAIGLLLAVVLRLLNGASSHLRYLVICAALLACGVAPVMTWAALAHKAPPLHAAQEPAGNLVAHPFIDTKPSGEDASNIHNSPSPTVASVTTGRAKAATPWRALGLQMLEELLPYAVGLWLAGVLALSLRLVFGWAQMGQLRRSGVAIPDGALRVNFRGLAERMGIRGGVLVLQSALVEVPTLIGLLRPMILLPASVFTGLTPGQLEAILAHELAHARRYDYLVNFFQTGIETVLFYHPAVWWIGRKLREERENCCDDIAIETMSDRAIYVSALAALEEGRGTFPSPLAMAASGAPLLNRVRRIAGVDRRKSGLAPVIATILIVGSLLAPLCGRMASGEDSKEAEKNAAAQKPGNQLVIELADGSRVVGTPSVDKLKMTTKYADLDVQLSLMRTIEFKGADRVAQVNLQDGDILSGQLATTEIAMETVLGHVVIPMEKVNKIQIRRTGIGKTLPEGCVLHYPFDKDEGEKVTDASGSGNDGATDGASFVSEGKAGGAMSFNGDRQAIIVKNAANLQFQDFTIMAWIKFREKNKATSTGTAGVGEIFGCGAGGYGMGIDADGTLILTKIGMDHVSSKLEIHDDSFHHVAVTKKGINIVFYLDGVADPAPAYAAYFEFNSNLAVGAVASNLDNSFLGLIREVAVFNRPLSDDEVKGIYESQK